MKFQFVVLKALKISSLSPILPLDYFSSNFDVKKKKKIINKCQVNDSVSYRQLDGRIPIFFFFFNFPNRHNMGETDTAF